LNSQYAEHLPEAWLRATNFFSALGDPYRQKILLLFEPREELCVNQIAALFALSRPAISHHLKIMRDAGLLQCQKRGKEVYYRVNDEYCLAMLQSTARYIAGRRAAVDDSGESAGPVRHPMAAAGQNRFGQ